MLFLFGIWRLRIHFSRVLFICRISTALAHKDRFVEVCFAIIMPMNRCASWLFTPDKLRFLRQENRLSGTKIKHMSETVESTAFAESIIKKLRCNHLLTKSICYEENYVSGINSRSIDRLQR